jgi:hypothetical protein
MNLGVMGQGPWLVHSISLARAARRERSMIRAQSFHEP